MSRRSILLTTTMCMALASTAAIDPASAHGGGGGFGGGGSFHSAGPGNFSHRPELAPAHTTMTSPAEHVRAFPVSKTVTAPFGLATQHILKAGNGVTRTGSRRPPDRCRHLSIPGPSP
jgi:hypothetical protein